MLDSSLKTCSKCRDQKPRSEFHKAAAKRDGLFPLCKTCVKERNTEHYQKNANQYRDRFLRRMYGISLDQYNEMLEIQGYRCAACRTDKEGARRFAVDHDHKCCPGTKSCGQCIRGLLCHTCNTALGHIESPRHQILVAYLEENKR